MKRLKVGVLYGGNSVEHEISIVSAIQVIKALDKIKYEVIPIYLTKNNKLYTGEELIHVDNYKCVDELLKKCSCVRFKRINNKGYLVNDDISLFKQSIDIIFPVVHGKNVEDGSLKFLLDMLDIPCVYSSISSLSLAQDKVYSKMLLENNNFPVLDYFYIKKNDYKYITLDDMDLKFPYIVKPATLGSSIGIEYAHNIEELYNCILDAFSFDNKVLVERALKDFKEVNCSAFRYKDKIYISNIERVYSSKEFLDFEDKYNSSDGMVKCKRELPASLSNEEIELVKRYTEDVYELFDCHGVIRVDFLIANKKVYVNEINSIPGSYAFYLWESCNIRFDKLLDMVIEQSIYDFKENNKLINTFNNFKIFDSSSFKLSLK